MPIPGTVGSLGQPINAPFRPQIKLKWQREHRLEFMGLPVRAATGLGLGTRPYPKAQAQKPENFRAMNIQQARKGPKPKAIKF